MRGVGFVEEKRADEQEQDHAQSGADDGRLSKTAVISFHQREHAKESGNEPRSLAQQKNVGVSVLMLGGDGGGAEDHHRSEEAQRERRTEKPAVDFQSSWHRCFLSLFPERGTGGLAFELVHQLFENTAAMLVTLKLVEAGAGWSEQDDVTVLGGERGDFHSAVERFSAVDGDAAGDLRFNFCGGGADEQRENGFLTQRFLQRHVVTPFFFAPRNV